MAEAVTLNTDAAVELASARDLVNIELMKMADEGLEFACVTTDEPAKSKLGELARKYPGRVFDVGIAEPNAVGIATGLALTGITTFVTAFGTFLHLRATDQIHTDVAYNDVKVRLIGTSAGLTSTCGPTHYSVTDIAMMRTIPNMTMVVPADALQAARLIRESMTYPGPIYMRLPRLEEPLVYANQEYECRIGKAVTAKDGDAAAIIACGSCVAYAVAASNRLAKEGIGVRVIDMHTIKPLDTAAVLDAAKTGMIVTVEDHSVIGGLGDAVAGVLFEAGLGIKSRKLGVPDHFASVGYPKALHAHYGYDAQGIVATLKAMLGR